MNQVLHSSVEQELSVVGFSETEAKAQFLRALKERDIQDEEASMNTELPIPSDWY